MAPTSLNLPRHSGKLIHSSSQKRPPGFPAALTATEKGRTADWSDGDFAPVLTVPPLNSTGAIEESFSIFDVDRKNQNGPYPATQFRPWQLSVDESQRERVISWNDFLVADNGPIDSSAVAYLPLTKDASRSSEIKPASPAELISDPLKKPQYQCRFDGCCHELFNTRSALNKHAIAHAPMYERRHECDLCDKRFYYPKDLRRHKYSVHDGVRQAICGGCGQAFKRLDTLKRHSKNKSACQKHLRAQKEPAVTVKVATTRTARSTTLESQQQVEDSIWRSSSTDNAGRSFPDSLSSLPSKAVLGDPSRDSTLESSETPGHIQTRRNNHALIDIADSSHEASSIGIGTTRDHQLWNLGRALEHLMDSIPKLRLDMSSDTEEDDGNESESSWTDIDSDQSWDEVESHPSADDSWVLGGPDLQSRGSGNPEGSSSAHGSSLSFGSSVSNGSSGNSGKKRKYGCDQFNGNNNDDGDQAPKDPPDPRQPHDDDLHEYIPCIMDGCNIQFMYISWLITHLHQCHSHSFCVKCCRFLQGDDRYDFERHSSKTGDICDHHCISSKCEPTTNLGSSIIPPGRRHARTNGAGGCISLGKTSVHDRWQYKFNLVYPGRALPERFTRSKHYVLQGANQSRKRKVQNSVVRDLQSQISKLQAEVEKMKAAKQPAESGENLRGLVELLKEDRVKITELEDIVSELCARWPAEYILDEGLRRRIAKKTCASLPQPWSPHTSRFTSGEPTQQHMNLDVGVLLPFQTNNIFPKDRQSIEPALYDPNLYTQPPMQTRIAGTGQTSAALSNMGSVFQEDSSLRTELFNFEQSSQPPSQEVFSWEDVNYDDGIEDMTQEFLP